MKKYASRAFTLVELSAVIAVISILVLITATIYRSVQVQARDSKNADAADKFADAIKLFTIKYEHFPKGGSASTTAIGAATECADGADGWAATGYVCDIEDSLVASGYLPSGFVASQSPNPLYPANKTGSQSLMVYAATTTGTPPVTKAMVMYSMESPSSNDSDNFNNELTKCYGSVPGSYSPRDTFGMKNGICVVVQTL
ncbi:prepilin-type N-terminal cleavage/methylation domain-containing protein [Microbacteriaceae bacterium]|nr:prepilin-type N-terminal cleavage/methylation domain-containing protein [Candidatus Saccharibacteria bacterium]